MTTIHARTQDQVLVATILPKLACNNKKTVKLHVDFDAAWNGYTKSALFYTSNDPTVYPEPLSTNGDCTVPAEVLADAGYLFITIQGLKTGGSEIKSTTPIRYKILPGTPSLVVSDPTPSVYQQLVNSTGSLAARMSAQEAAGTVDGAEIIGVRTDADGNTHASAHDAVVAQTPIIPQLAAFILGEGDAVVINADTETITFPNDTLIMGYGGQYYQLTDAGGNTVCSYKMDTSAVNVVYQISTGNIFVQSYRTKIDRRNQILLCSIRRSTTGVKISISCNYTVIMAGVTYKSLALQEGARRSSFLAPLITGLVDKYAVINTTDGTITFPDDTLIIDPCGGLGGTNITYQLSEAKGNTVCKYNDYTQSSAVKIFYNPETKTLEAAPYDSYINAHLKLILLATIRTSNKAVAINIPYICDGLLSGVDYSEWTSKKNTNTVKAINHRGYTDAPENTLAAFKLSKEKGFAYVECDVSFTSDGHAVLLHDATIDRTSDGTGSIAEMTLAAVRALDFGSWKSADYAGEKIPTFEEFILLCKRLGLHPYIELKTGTEAQIKGLVDVVKRYGMKGKVTWISFNSACLGYVKAVDTSARLGFVVDSVTASTITTITQSLRTGKNEVFVDCAASNANEAAVALCADADIPLEVWTVNTEAAILALNPYVSGVTSDNLIAGKVLSDAEMNI